MAKVAIAAMGLTIGFGTAMAEQISVPMLLADDIQAAVNPKVLQGVSGDSVGAIYFPDKALALKIEQGEGDAAPIVKQWQKTHVFYLIPFTISILPADERIPERVEIVTAFSPLGNLAQQPITIDLFPKTGFKPASYSGSGEVKVNASVQLEPPTAATAAAGVSSKAVADANAAFRFNYAPAYANIVAGFASGSAFWSFSRTQDKYPAGEIPMKLLIALPRTQKSTTLSLSFDVRATFSGPWWSKGRAIATFKTVVGLPDRT